METLKFCEMSKPPGFLKVGLQALLSFFTQWNFHFSFNISDPFLMIYCIFPWEVVMTPYMLILVSTSVYSTINHISFCYFFTVSFSGLYFFNNRAYFIHPYDHSRWHFPQNMGINNYIYGFYDICYYIIYNTKTNLS